MLWSFEKIFIADNRIYIMAPFSVSSFPKQKKDLQGFLPRGQFSYRNPIRWCLPRIALSSRGFSASAFITCSEDAWVFSTTRPQLFPSLPMFRSKSVCCAIRLSILALGLSRFSTSALLVTFVEICGTYGVGEIAPPVAYLPWFMRSRLSLPIRCVASAVITYSPLERYTNLSLLPMYARMESLVPVPAPEIAPAV